MFKTILIATSLLALNALAEPGFMITKDYYPVHGGHGVAVETLDEGTRNNFSSLMQLFANSPSAKFDDVKGAYSGRCFTHFASTTLAGLLVVDEVKSQKKAVAIVYDRDETFFDKYDSYSVTREKTWFWDQVNPASSAEPFVTSSKADENDSTWNFAKSSSGIVMTATYNGKSGGVYLYGHSSVNIEHGATYGVCLFDRKL